jgi:hypothetical protein
MGYQLQAAVRSLLKLYFDVSLQVLASNTFHSFSRLGTRDDCIGSGRAGNVAPI